MIEGIARQLNANFSLIEEARPIIGNVALQHVAFAYVALTNVALAKLTLVHVALAVWDEHAF